MPFPATSSAVQGNASGLPQEPVQQDNPEGIRCKGNKTGYIASPMAADGILFPLRMFSFPQGRAELPLSFSMDISDRSVTRASELYINRMLMNIICSLATASTVALGGKGRTCRMSTLPIGCLCPRGAKRKDRMLRNKKGYRGLAHTCKSDAACAIEDGSGRGKDL